MPELPSWAAGGRIVLDAEYHLAFIRFNRRARWLPYAITDRGYEALPSLGQANLEKTREAVLKAVGASIGQMALSLDPRGAFTHWGVAAPGSTTTANQHACGAPWHLKTAYDPRQATCPECLSVANLDIEAQAKKVGVDLPKARQVVIGFRTINAMGKLLEGKPVTDVDI